MSHKIKLINLKELEISSITLKGKNSLTMHYEHDMQVVYIATGCWSCPYGMTENGKLITVISDHQFYKVKEIDELGEYTCRKFHSLDDTITKLPYKPLIGKIDGLDILELVVDKKCRIFDKDGNILSDREFSSCVNGQFTAQFLLTFTLNIIDNDMKYMYWSVNPKQIKVNSFSSLPEGCQIFESVDLFQESLQKRSQDNEHTTEITEITENPIQYDPDVNELLD